MTETNTESLSESMDVGDYLAQVSNDPNWQKENTFPRVYQNIKKGDLVLKQQAFKGSERYLLVDIDISKEPVVADRQKLVMSSIRTLFDTKTIEDGYSKDSSYYHKHSTKDSEKRHVVPLSELLRNKRGECVEVATVTQLLIQERGDEVYMISGHLYEEGAEDEQEAHTWNIIKKADGYYLVDAKNGFKSKINAVVKVPKTGRYFLDTEKKPEHFYFMD
tara:strand:- start:688 stop:1344 length:657 start_codon:yes stop_codon:yes gene_type:complete